MFGEIAVVDVQSSLGIVTYCSLVDISHTVLDKQTVYGSSTHHIVIVRHNDGLAVFVLGIERRVSPNLPFVRRTTFYCYMDRLA